METKRNVRRRREERIRELRGYGPSPEKEMFQSHFHERDSFDPPGRWEPGIGAGDLEELEPRQPIELKELRELRELKESDRLRGGYGALEPYTEERDPEEVWKMKERELFARRPSKESLFGGIGPLPPEDGEPAKVLAGALRRLRIQFGISALLLAVAWGLFHYPLSGAEPVKQVIRNMLDKEWNFTAVAAWYENRFGDLPSFLPAFHTDSATDTRQVGGKQKSFAVPLSGKVAVPYTAGHPWMMISAAPGSPVAAMDTGIVRFAGYRDDTGYTVVLRHSSGYETTYGFLTPGDLEKGSWLEAGAVVGHSGTDPATGAGALYFALTKDNNAMDPAEVVRFD